MRNITAEGLLALKDNFETIKLVGSICLKDHSLTNPILSIVIPTYDRPDLLQEAIDSALKQAKTDEVYEVVVIDNNPIRNCPTEQLIASRYSTAKNLAYYKNSKNLGMFGNWNRACTLAKGKWICMLHDDDLLSKHYLFNVSKVLKKKRNAILVGNCPDIYHIFSKKYRFGTLGRIVKRMIRVLLKSAGRLIRGRLIQLNLFDFLSNIPIRPAGFVVSKAVVKEVGGFGSDTYIEDYVFFLKIFLKYPKQIYVFDKPLAIYRMIDNASLKKDIKESFVKYNFLLKSYLLSKLKTNYTFFLRYLIKEPQAEKNLILRFCSQLIVICYSPYLLPNSRYEK